MSTSANHPRVSLTEASGGVPPAQANIIPVDALPTSEEGGQTTVGTKSTNNPNSVPGGSNME